MADYLAELRFKAANYAKKDIDEEMEVEIAHIVAEISNFMND